MKLRRSGGLLLVVIALGGLTGCGADEKELPASVAAQVRGHIITKAALEHAIVGQLAVEYAAKPMPSYLPSDVKGCVATHLRKANASRTGVERQCRQERERSKIATLRLLIRSQWYRLEARRRGLEVPTVNELARYVKGRFNISPQDYSEVGRAVLRRVTVAPKVTPSGYFSNAQIADYYHAHRERYRRDDTRVIVAVVARKRSQAHAAADQLRRGREPHWVAKKLGLAAPYESPQNTSVIGDTRIERTARRTPRGGVRILKEPRRWFVFRVDAVTLVAQQPYGEARNPIELELSDRRDRKRFAAYNARLLDRYADGTTCAEEYKLPECE